MLSVEAPAKFILTLQSVPPFLVESILALALVVLLAVPLIAHIQLLLDNNKKSSTMGATNRRKLNPEERRNNTERTVVMHYPTLYNLDKSSNSELHIALASMRRTFSSPMIKHSAENLKDITSQENFVVNCEEIEHHKQLLQEMLMMKQKTCLPLERSSPFVITNDQLPIIDISAFDYDSYRHKLIESSLRRQYGDRQAPGNVVLNSIHLNSIGSQTGIELSERYSHSLFDFIEEYYDATKALSTTEKEYLHPLDHFLAKRIVRPNTADRGTETKESMTELDQVPELIDFREQSPISINGSPVNHEKRRGLEESMKNSSKLTIRSRRSFSLPRTSSRTSTTMKTNVATSGRKSSTNPMTQQLFNREENLSSNVNGRSNIFQASLNKMADRGLDDTTICRTSRSRTPRNMDNNFPQMSRNHEVFRQRVHQGKSSTESFSPGTTKPSEYSEALSTDRDEKESVTCASASSSEAGSSCSSRPHEKRVVRSRPSSLSSKSQTIGKISSQTRQWYMGNNPNPSFNRNYPEIQKDTSMKMVKSKLNTRPKSTGGRFAWDVPDVPRHNWCDEPSADTENEKSGRPIPQERPRTANLVYNRRRTPEKRNMSDTVLPVLESVIDLRVDVPYDAPDDFSMNIDSETFTGLPKREQSPKRNEFKRQARSRDKKISSESFVKPLGIGRARQVEGVTKSQLEKKSNDKDRLDDLKVVGKSSSGIKPVNRPGSTSRLPVHVGIDKTKLNKIEDRNKIESTEDQDKLFEKSHGNMEKNPAGVVGRAKRPSTAGCLQSRTSSLSPKMELSIENLQSNNLTNDSAGAKSKLESDHLSKIPSRSPSLGSKKASQSSRTSVSKEIKGPNSRLTENDTYSLRKNANEENNEKRPFLRARSGKYGAPKLNVIEQTRKNLTVGYSSSKRNLENKDEEERELLKLPTEGSKAALVMRRELRTYIKKIKLILSNRDKTLQTKDLASLSITEAIIPELRAHLSPREIQELQDLLHRVEKQQGNIFNLGLGLLTGTR